MTSAGPDNTGSEQQEYVDDKSYVCFSFARFPDAFIIDFEQVAFDVVGDARTAIPSEELDERAWWKIVPFHFI